MKDKTETKPCVGCGKTILKWYACGNRGAIRERYFCTRNCQNNTNAKKHYWARPVVRLKKSEYDFKYREKNHEKRILQCREWYKNNKNRPDVVSRQREYSKKYRKKHLLNSRRYEKKHPEKIREIKLLRRAFGTSNIPITIKKQYAIYHLSNRATRCSGNPIEIDKHKIPGIINQINKGETYAAY